MRVRMDVWCLLAASAAIVDTAGAHHAFTMHFDPTRTIEIRGVVVDFKLRSPHSSFVVDGVAFIDGVAQSDTIERWELEAGAVPGMRRLGIDRDTFRPGDGVTVTAWPNRDPEFNFAFGTEFVAADSSVFSILSDPLAAAGGAADEAGTSGSGVRRIVGRWRSPGYVNGPESPLPLNAAGRAAWESYDPKLSPANTCEPQTIPGTFSAPYLFDLRMGGGTVTLHNEPYNIVRTVRIDAEPAPAHPNGQYPSGQFGVATATIAGDSLVIESSNFPPSLWGLGIATHVNGGGADVPSSAQKTVIERFSVSDDGQTLFLDYELSDPAYLSEPYEGRFELFRVSDENPMYPYECDVESASMFSRDASDPPLRVGSD